MRSPVNTIATPDRQTKKASDLYFPDRSRRPDPDAVEAPVSLKGRLTRLIAGIHPRETLFATRGFPCDRAGAQATLETAADSFVRGYNLAVSYPDTAGLDAALEQSAPHLRGFFIEGAAMGVAIAEAMPWHRAEDLRLADFLLDRAMRHPYLTSVGAGWAMAKLPWRRAAIHKALDPALASLAYDGWGFHDCFFTPARMEAPSHRGLPRGAEDLAARARDRGAGRALWFISGGSASRALHRLLALDPARHADVASGLGLAVTYAGGLEERDAGALVAARPDLRAPLAQGSAFALEAHARARSLPPGAERIAAAITGLDMEPTLEIVRALRPAGSGCTTLVEGLRRYDTWCRETGKALGARAGWEPS